MIDRIAVTLAAVASLAIAVLASTLLYLVTYQGAGPCR